MNEMTRPVADRAKPMRLQKEVYFSESYARDEGEKLWPKVWQAACRAEELAKVGDFVTYDILDESIIVVRTTKDEIKAFYNVCLHRGRRLTKGCGHATQFACKFHGWRWNINGENSFVLDPEDWGGALTPENLRLHEVKCDLWGGWVWINMDPDCESLSDYLRPASPMLDAFELDKMRYRWRQWLYFPCNWKVALEAFIESYHLDASHPQLTRFGANRWWCRAEGKHAWHGIGERRVEGTGMSRGVASPDLRVAVAEQLTELWDTVGMTTRTLVDAANRLKDELPEGTPPEQIYMHLGAQAMKTDAERGVIWPKVDHEHMAACGLDWHVFPNTIILPQLTDALCYRARPNGYDPDSCIFEVCMLERYPEGEEPKTEWVYEPDPTKEKWRLILAQDFQNMPEVQKGLKSRGFPGPQPNPVSEIPVTHFHEVLAQYMGVGAPEPII